MSLGLTIVESEMPLTFSVSRSLTEADLLDNESRKQDHARGKLKEITRKHHLLAKYLADGLSQRVAGAMLGYSDGVVSVLANDAAFKELIAHYARENASDDLRFQERMLMIGAGAIDEIDRRLSDPELREDVKMRELISVIEITADRTGFGKKTESRIDVNVGIADRLAQARERVKMIDITPEKGS